MTLDLVIRGGTVHAGGGGEPQAFGGTAERVDVGSPAAEGPDFA